MGGHELPNILASPATRCLATETSSCTLGWALKNLVSPASRCLVSESPWRSLGWAYLGLTGEPMPGLGPSGLGPDSHWAEPCSGLGPEIWDPPASRCLASG